MKDTASENWKCGPPLIPMKGAIQHEEARQHLPGSPVRLRSFDGVFNRRVREDGCVELRGFFEVVVEPQRR